MIDCIYTPGQIGEAAWYLLNVTREFGGKLKNSLTPRRKRVEDIAKTSLPRYDYNNVNRLRELNYDEHGFVGRTMLKTIYLIEATVEKAKNSGDNVIGKIEEKISCIVEEPVTQVESIPVQEETSPQD